MNAKSLIIALIILFATLPTLALEINSCMQITAPGNYELSQNISGLLRNEIYCIGIFANNVVLDGNGFWINGSGTGIGIYVDKNNVKIRDVKVFNYSHGISLYPSSDSSITRCTIIHCNHGIYLQSTSKNNTISNCTLEKSFSGISLYSSANNTISNCTIEKNSQEGIGIYSSNNNNIRNSKIENNGYGIYISNSSNNTIYNNLFNNLNNFRVYGSSINTWNTTLQQGRNILGGNLLGGNAWLKPDGTGYSQTCTDSDGNGICDQPYTLASNNVDHLPLKSAPLQPWQRYDGNGNGRIEDQELITAIIDWLNNRMSDQDLINVILKWLQG